MTTKTINEELFDRLVNLPPRMRTWLFGERPHDLGRGHEMRHERPDHRRFIERPDFRGLHEQRGHHGPHEEFDGIRGRGTMFIRERVLGVLVGCEAGLRQKDIAEEIRVNPSSMSELVDKLENDGYVERTVDPSDKRATLIVLTEKGRARAYELEDGRNERLNALFCHMTDEEKRELIRLLDKLMAGDR